MENPILRTDVYDSLTPSSLYMQDWFISDSSQQLGSPLPLFAENSMLEQDDFWSDILPTTPVFRGQYYEPFAFEQSGQMTVSPSDSEDSAGLELPGASLHNEDQLGGSNDENSTEDAEGFMPDRVTLTLPENRENEIATASSLSNSQTDQELVDSHVHFGGSTKRLASPCYDDAQAGPSFHKRAKISSPQSVLEEAETEIEGTWNAEESLHTRAERRSQPKESSGQTYEELENDHPNSLTQAPSANSSRARGGGQSGSQTSKESRWAEQLLSACAAAIASNNIIRTQHLMWVLNDLASFSGDSNQRLAAYVLKALFSRVTGTVSLPPTPPLPVDPSSGAPRPFHRALLRFHDASPWHQMVYTIANGALLEACEGRETVHIVDIGVSQGTQWPTFIEALATRPSGAPKLMRLTTVRDPRGSPFSGGLQTGAVSTEFVARLEPFAKKLDLNLELKNVSTPLESLQRDDLEPREGEALLICGQFRLHQISEVLPARTQEQRDTSKCVMNQQSPRDSFLRFIHDLNPDAFVLSENDADHSSPDFLTRLKKVVDSHWTFLDSTSASFRNKDCEERHIIEGEAAMALLNNVAYEGAARIERNETHRAWSSRIQRAGFYSNFPREEVLENAKSLLRKHDSNWDLMVDEESMVLRWKGQAATFCSVWRASNNS